MFMSNKYRRPWSDAEHYVRRLTSAYDICSTIRQVFADNVTLYMYSILVSLICDVIYEKGPYCGTNIIGPDQTPRMMRGV